MQGIDISAYQGNIPWSDLHNIDFGIVKVTEGEGYINPYWQQNALAMEHNKKVRGFYMFSRPGIGYNTPEGEVAYFYSQVQPHLKKGDLIAFDIEKTQLNPIETSGWAVRAMGHLDYLAGFHPLIYSYPDFINNNLKAPSLGSYPLWLAWYQEKLPGRFAQWSKIALWQKGQMRIEGVEGEVDQNIFFLGRKELEAYGKK